MGKILFASNNPTHFGPNTSTDLTRVRDSARVPYSIKFPSTIQTPEGIIKNTANGNVWIHFRCYSDNSNFSGESSRAAVTVRDDAGRTIFVITRGSNTAACSSILYDGNGLNTASVSGGNIQQATGAWDIHLDFSDGFNIDCNLYQNAVLIASHTISNVVPINQVGSVEWGEGFWQAGWNGYISEVIISDSDTRLARLNMVRPDAIGFHTQWDGLVGTLADNNLNTGMTTALANQKHSVILEAYANNEIISNLVLASQHFRGANSPTKIRHFMRASNLDYDHADVFDVGLANSVGQTDYEINPATSLPWDVNDLPVSEFGFKSEA